MTLPISLACMTNKHGHMVVRVCRRFVSAVADTWEQDNDFSEFQRPDHYIRYIGACGLAVGVPFSDVEQSRWRRISPSRSNMTWTSKVCLTLFVAWRPAQSHIDQEWLDAINIERKKDQINLVAYETFEIIMDRLEKEYFDLVRRRASHWPDRVIPLT